MAYHELCEDRDREIRVLAEAACGWSESWPSHLAAIAAAIAARRRLCACRAPQVLTAHVMSCHEEREQDARLAAWLGCEASQINATIARRARAAARATAQVARATAQAGTDGRRATSRAGRRAERATARAARQRAAELHSAVRAARSVRSDGDAP